MSFIFICCDCWYIFSDTNKDEDLEMSSPAKLTTFNVTRAKKNAPDRSPSSQEQITDLNNNNSSVAVDKRQETDKRSDIQPRSSKRFKASLTEEQLGKDKIYD